MRPTGVFQLLQMLKRQKLTGNRDGYDDKQVNIKKLRRMSSLMQIAATE